VLMSPAEEEEEGEARCTPLQVRLFEGAESTSGASMGGVSTPKKEAGGDIGGGQDGPMRIEVPLSTLLDSPPGLC